MIMILYYFYYDKDHYVNLSYILQRPWFMAIIFLDNQDTD